MEKKRIFGKMLELAVRTVMENHVYQHYGRFYKQSRGMPIGLRLSGVVAELIMNCWLEKVEMLIVKNSLGMYMNDVYVDDDDLLMEVVR